jgi:hypothetical protein
LKIVFCDAKFWDFAYTIGGATKSIPPHYFKKKSGYIYDVTVSVSPANPTYSTDESFGIICRLPDQKVTGVILNREHQMMRGMVPLQFSFHIQSSERGAVAFEIGIVNNETGTVVPVQHVPSHATGSFVLD